MSTPIEQAEDAAWENASPEFKRGYEAATKFWTKQTKAPIATIHVDGSFVHVEWHRYAPNVCHMEVYDHPTTPAGYTSTRMLSMFLADEVDTLIIWRTRGVGDFSALYVEP
jgi:hypothetical protein